MRAVGPPLRLWDVDNVEAFVARAVKAGLDARSARLNHSQYDRCFQFCLLRCWEVAGLQADGKTPRHLYRVHGFIRPAGRLDSYIPIELPTFESERAAQLALEGLRERSPVAFARVLPFRPRSWYDPAKANGLKFGTYAWRLIVNYRIDDWYRSDHEFGDTRYASNRRDEVSLEELADRGGRWDDHEHDDHLRLPAPLGRLEVLDSLNAHHYQDASEEVLTREAFGFRS